MRRFLLRFGKHRRGIAALEFGLCAPFLIAGMAAAFDYGYAMWARGCLTTAVADGAYYAVLTGTSVTAANIKTVVQKATPLSGIQVTTAGPVTYLCPTLSIPASYTTEPSATTTCPANVGGGPAGYWITITAQYTLAATWPPLSPIIYETVTVRLQ